MTIKMPAAPDAFSEHINPAASTEPKIVGSPTIIEVDLSSVRPNPYNPNEMEAEQFNVLAEDVQAQGMDQPLVVRRLANAKPGEPQFEIVDGEHRFRAATVAGLKKVLVSVKEWDDTEARLHTLRRNVHGENNPAKFTELVRQVNQSGMDLETIRARSAIDQKSFQRLYRLDTPEKKDKAKALELKSLSAGSEAKTFAVANLSNMVRDIVSTVGAAQLNNGFVSFQFKGTTCAMVSMTAKMLTAIEQIKGLIDADGLPEGALTSAIERALVDTLNKIELGEKL